MREHNQCPECGNTSSEVVNTEWFEDHVERHRVCDECPTGWTVLYSDPVVVETVDYS